MSEEIIEKITVYKLKKSVKHCSDFVKTQDSKKEALPQLQELEIDDVDGFEGKFRAWAAYKITGGKNKTDADIPWLSFINTAKPGGSKFAFSGVNTSPSAIVVIEISLGESVNFYALTFGLGGDSFLDHDKIIPDFGIKVGMNICAENALKRIQTSMHEAISTQTERQISTQSSLSSFNMNSEKEFLRMLSGAATADYPNISSFSGKESISIKVNKEHPLHWGTLIPFLHSLGKVSNSDRYKSIFSDYDKFPFENDRDVINDLDKILMENVKSGHHDNIHLAPPEFIDFDNVLFTYNADADADGIKLYEDLSLKDYLNTRRRALKDEASINSLKNAKISTYDATNESIRKNRWSVYKCIVAEVKKDHETYILSLGQWRRISSSLKEEVDNFIDSISCSDPKYLPEGISIWNPVAKGGKNGTPYTGENQEAVFNAYAANNLKDELFLFDKGKIEVAGQKKYEICDLLHKDRKFIQVKRFSAGSASISHLFVQVRFYTEAFLFDERCRKAMREYVKLKLSDGDPSAFLDILPTDRKEIDAGKYTILICILSENGDLSVDGLPFMSQYELMHTVRYITNMGMNCEVTFKKVVFGP